MINHIIKNLTVLCIVALLGACATESKRSVKIETVASYKTDYQGKKSTLVVGNFNNRSNYMQGLFSSGGDRLGSQGKNILKSHLQQTNRFILVDRDSMKALQQEAQLSGTQQTLTGAKYVLSGSVTEFGRKETGDKQLFGILGRGKQQIAYAKVSLNIIDVKTSQVVYSTQGAGEYQLSNREIIGFGGSSGYDSTLNGKVLNFAITQAVDNLVSDLEAGNWSVD